MSFHDSAQKIGYQMLELTKVVKMNGMTPEVARDLITLILQLKKLTLEDDNRNITHTVWIQVLNFYRNLKESKYEFNGDKYIKKIYAKKDGQIIEVIVKEGDQVWAQKPLIKIINSCGLGKYISSKDAGKIERIHIKNGDTSYRNKLLIELNLKDSKQDYDSLEKHSIRKQEVKELIKDDDERESKIIKT